MSIIPSSFQLNYCCPKDSITPDFMDSVLELVTTPPRPPWILEGIGKQTGVSLPIMRDTAVRKFLATDAEWFFSVDSDIQFHADVPYRLLEVASREKVRMVTGHYVGYVGRQNGLSTVWFDFGKDGKLQTVENLLDKPQRLAAAGMGCVMIHREVFERVEQIGKSPLVWFGHDPSPNDGSPLSEDLTFFLRARRCGFRLVGDSSIAVGHRKSRIENIYTLYQAELLADMEAKDNAIDSGRLENNGQHDERVR